jgi:hypothetical protein
MRYALALFALVALFCVPSLAQCSRACPCGCQTARPGFNQPAWGNGWQFQPGLFNPSGQQFDLRGSFQLVPRVRQWDGFAPPGWPSSPWQTFPQFQQRPFASVETPRFRAQLGGH